MSCSEVSSWYDNILSSDVSLVEPISKDGGVVDHGTRARVGLTRRLVHHTCWNQYNWASILSDSTIVRLDRSISVEHDEERE